MERIFCKIKRVKRKLDGKRITAKVMSAVLIASSMLNAFAPVAAYAAEPELATVSLSETQHGKLSFDGTEDMTLAVEVGTDVTVNVTPDEGYFSDGITVFKGEEDGKAVDVKDGKATFTVEGDTIVTSTFYQNGSLGSAPLKAADVDEGKAVKSVEDYIRKNADAKYVGKSDNLARADVLTVTTSVVDGSKLPDATLDSLWADDNGDGFSEHWDALMSQAVSHAVLFEADPDSDYYVGWAGADITDAKLTDWGAAENNADAKMRDGFIVDDATGLVYVPKSYTEKDDSGKPMVASSRIQLLYTAKDANAEATFDFDATSDGVSGDVSGKGKVTVPATSPTTEVVIANDGEARKAVNGRTIDSVTVNGIEYTPDMGMWQYDSETGALEFAMAPAGIHAMSVKMSDGFGKDVASFFRMPEPRMSVNEIGTWEFKTAPTVGATFVTKGHNRYSGKTRPGYTLPAVENPAGGRYENKTINQAMGWQPVNLNALKAGNYSIKWTSEIWAQDTGWVKIGNEARVALTCGHIGVDPSFNSNPGYNDTAHKDNNHGQHIRVFSVSGNEAVIGVTVPTAMTQAGAGFFRIRWRIGSGKLKIHKASANASITNGNDCYSLEGAEFAVLNAAGQNMGTLRTDANGDTNTLELPEGTYTVRETKPPKGYLPAPDQQVTVRGGQQTTAQVSDKPASDPMSILVGKYDGDKEYNANNLPQGSASLEGAEFTIEYFDTVDYDSYDAIKKAGVKPTRSWVVRTNENGFARLDENSFVSGDDFFYENDVITIPRGSVAIYESKAPEGYKLNSDVSFQKIQENPLDAVITFNAPKVPESVKRGGVSVQKLDSETGKTPQGGASLEGIAFSIINDNENAVKVDGNTYAKGETVKVITTDAKGFATTGADTLPYGDYIIRETATNDGYLNTSNEMRVTVSEDGKMYSFNAKDDIVRGGVEITKHDIETGTGDPLGGASLDGTQFQVKSLNDKPVIVGGVTYTKGQVIQPLLTIEDGHVSSDAQWLPFGLYSIQEVKAGEGYLLTDGEEHRFRISKDGALVNPFDGAFENQVMRSDLEFTKKGEDGQDRLAGVAFKLTSKTTGESHVVVTDENGYFSSASSWNKHTHETNANDWALDAEGVIDSSKLDATAGVWFGGTTPDDSKGALPYDTYLIEELRCTANEGYQLIETTVIVSRDGKVYDFGTLTDVKASITTKAYDPMDGDSLVGMGEVKVSDKVTYANLFPNRDYKLTAELHDSATGDVLLDASGHPITVEKRFTAQSPTGFEVVEFTIDTIALGGKTITVYEKLYDDGGSLIAEHTDKSDVNQQVTVIEPEIGTTAVDGADGDKNVATDDKATVTDRVAYKNLIPGKEYTVKGTLHIKKTDDEGKVTEEILKVDGKPVTAETTFTPESAEGTVDVTFTFDSLSLKDKTHLVAFESLEHDGHELASHADIEDEGQTVTVRNPRISTTALDGIDKDKNVVTDDETVIIDTVAYENLVPGREYTLKGSMQVKAEKDGKPVAKPLEVGGKPVKAETTFTPEKSDGTANVTFRFSSRDIEPGTELVMFESLERGGNVLATHEDIGDVNQTVTVTAPAISTSARDAIDGDKDVVVDDVATVIDTVEYRNLVPGKEYTLNGKLHSKSNGKPLMVGDKPVTGQTTFTPEKADGKVEVTFTFDSRDLEDKTDIVVFESLVRSGTEIASHADIDDKNQTVTVTHPEIGTTAVDGADGDKNVITDDSTEVIDTVEYTGLIPGKEYTLKGTLHVKVTDEEGKVTEKPLEVDGKPVTAETTFTPEKADGKVDVVFHFNSLTIPHDTEIVAFESLEKNGVEIAAHADIEDKAQTVTVKHPFITTSALDGIDGDKNIVTDDETVIVDTVKYSGLIPGKEYTLKGSMQVKKSDEDGNLTAEPLEVDGEPVTAETTFTPETASGEVEVTFTFDSRAIADKTDIVVFESLERTGVEIASHADIEDGKQTTTVTRPQIGTTALDGHDGDKNVVTDGKTTVIDTVEYKNVIPGKTYTLKGSLHVKVTDEEGNVTEKALEVDGKPVTAETTFTPEKSDGKVEVTFTFDSTGIPQDTEMVAFESLEKNGVELVAHADIEDGKQTTTAHVTGISTTATDGLDGDKNVIADAETTITDDVAYENALTGIGYTMTGILMDAETGLPILTGDGSEKYTEADVAAFMQQLLDVLGLSAQDEDEGIADIVVSDETAEDGSVKKSQTVRVHADGTFEVIDTTYETDEDGLTSATVDASGKVGYDALTDEQKKAISDVAVLKDSGIVLNYSATGELPVSIDMDALGKFIADNEDLISHLVYQTAEFTPEKYDGTVTMDFHFNANDVIDRLGGETKDIVVFEVMSKNAVADEEGSAPVIVASECDLDSEEQTVNLVPTVIGTTATDKSDGDHTLMAGKDAVITDRVTYEGLIPGKEYTLKATLMDKKTGEMLSINDQHVTAELKFTPNSQNGTIDIDLGKFDASSLDGHDLVVFEELYKQTEQGNEATEVLVAEHKDIDDEGQTVTVTTTPPGGFFGKTGGNDFFIVVSIAALAVLACGCAYYGIKNRRAAKAEDAAVDEGGDTDNGDVSGDSEA
ncbi:MULTISPECIES: VaFE repeat-containing surface-anchored protein [unclassified Holdemanella]|uniref:VaFE repeat-containing surface-anchored protein n=1 Tax=unclassified Holdemanella TaxID=2633909 RepID=UPI001D0B6798|nr:MULTISPECIES: VaFE repeat-containing surface-anchored protein [unclassified Holdemanella]MCB8640105.1 VaFE repeat-containing surface-anchored protein [Holdemanella sp. DFI.5.55]MCG5648545.1 VaFE repeat-containing surface-anchored protein [Holdemanella sp. DFI.5.21]